MDRKAKSLCKSAMVGDDSLMKLMEAIALLIMLSLAVVPATGQMTAGQMTEYQRGVANGLKIGFFMGEYYGGGNMYWTMQDNSIPILTSIISSCGLLLATIRH